MLVHNALPRALMLSIFCAVGARDARVSNCVASLGWALRTWARNSPSELMVRGMPLKLMHLRPISRISSAAERGDSEEREGSVATLWRTAREAGELRVNVAAA